MEHLRGECACGRNQYVVELPTSYQQHAHVFFDNTAVNRHHQATPLTAWLRIPLPWYHSTTHAHFPDETHASIRRVYTTADDPTNSRRVFCGYCGTMISRWSEGHRHLEKQGEGQGDESEWMLVTLGSLSEEDLGRLEGLGLVPSEPTSGEVSDAEGHALRTTTTSPVAETRAAHRRNFHDVANRGVPYFEELVEDSRFGRIKRQKGGGRSGDGRVRVEWEVTEWTAGGEDEDMGAGEVLGKRKIGDM